MCDPTDSLVSSLKTEMVTWVHFMFFKIYYLYLIFIGGKDSAELKLLIIIKVKKIITTLKQSIYFGTIWKCPK